MIPIPIIAIYSRKSKFTGKGESIQSQVELCKEYAKKNLSVEGFLVFEDEGYSGGNTNRPKYRKMLEQASAKKFHILICYRLDRISRNISDFTHLVELLNENNISFISIRENFDTSTPIGRAMMFIASVFSQLERETISERIRDNMYSLAKRGRWLGGRTPTGFTSKQVEYYDENNNKRRVFKLMPNHTELELVKQLYDKYLELGSLSKLEIWTLENNMLTRKNKPFDKSILRFILSNPVYAVADKSMYDYFSFYDSHISADMSSFNNSNGLMVYNRHDEKKNKVIRKDKSQWIVAVGLHPGIISSQNWIAVQNLLAVNSNKAPRLGTGKIGLLTSLLKCKSCGSTMRISVSRKNNKTYHYYKCLTKERSKGTECNIANINGNAADRLVLERIMTIEYGKKALINCLRSILRSTEKILSNFDLDDKNLKNEILHYENRINNLTLQLSENENCSASKYIIKQIEEFDGKIQDLKSKLIKGDENHRLIDEVERNFRFLLNFINDLHSNFDMLDFEEKKRFINLLIEEIIWDGHTLEIVCYNRY